MNKLILLFVGFIGLFGLCSSAYAESEYSYGAGVDLVVVKTDTILSEVTLEGRYKRLENDANDFSGVVVFKLDPYNLNKVK